VRLQVQNVDKQVMMDSKIGFSVKALRKNGDATVAMLAKDLTEKWRAQVRGSAPKDSSPKDAAKDAAKDAPKDDAKDAGAPPAKKHKAAPAPAQPKEAPRGPPAAPGVDGCCPARRAPTPQGRAPIRPHFQLSGCIRVASRPQRGCSTRFWRGGGGTRRVRFVRGGGRGVSD